MDHVLVTGGSRGIGRAASLLAAQRGWSVSLNFVRDSGAATLVCESIRRAGGQAEPLQGDIAQEDDVLSVFDKAEANLGALTGVVINAGIVAHASPLADMEADRLRRMFEVNILGAYFCAREAARRLSTSRGGKGGSIVIVSSAASRLGAPNEYVDYAGSKGAMDSLTIGLSKELAGDNVRVNAVRPAFIETDIHASGGRPDRAQRLGATTPMGRSGKAEEVGEAIVWLLSDAASYVTGTFVDMAGGR